MQCLQTKILNSCVNLTTHVKIHIKSKYPCDVCVKIKEDVNKNIFGKLMLSTTCSSNIHEMVVAE